jgi:ABC-type phosphate/phosphonate transport system permease subunit
MTNVGAASVDKYGDSALMHGLNMAFAGMAVSAVVLFAIALLGTREN